MPSNEGSVGSSSTTIPKRVLVIGGSYSGLAAALNLLDLCQGRDCRFAGASNTEAVQPAETREKVPVQITIVDERDGYFHLIGTPRAFASEEYASFSWRKFADIPALQTPAIKFIQGSVTGVDCERKISTIKEAGTNKEITQKYDYLVASSGLRRTWPSAPESRNKDDYFREVEGHIAKTKLAQESVVVIGGGAVGIEIASELKEMHPNLKVILIHSRDKLLSSEPLPDEFRDRALELLHDTGVETIMGSRVIDTTQAQLNGNITPSYTLTLANGRTVKAGYVINAISKYSPTTTYLPSSVLDKEGYVKVNPTLNFIDEVPNAQYHFAAGDLALLSGIKRAGRAMYHGHYAGMNIYQRMLNERFGTPPKFSEVAHLPPSMAIAVGKNTVACGPEGVVSGEEIAKVYFEDDLGFGICWNYLKLGEAAES
ncbi:oxidation resistance protein 1 [Blastomyces gilchristii]